MLPTFPSRYWSTIGLPGVFSLAGWSPRVPAGFLVSRRTQVPLLSTARLPLRGCHPLRPAFPDRSGSLAVVMRGALLPPACLDTPGLGSVPFARHYSGHRYFFLFLRVLRCFSSPRSPRLKPVSGRLPDGLPHSEIPGSKLVAVPRGFSQLSTSFIASGSLGIHRPPFLISSPL